MRIATLLTLLALGTGQQSMPEPPEHYAAIETWVQGEIVEILHEGGVLHVVPADPSDPDAARYARNDAFPGLGYDGARTAVLELRYAKGWMYFDDPDSGEQRRYNLREGRRRLRVGQLIEIGRANDFRGGHERTGVAVGGARATQVRFEGWILARVNAYRAERK